MIIGQRQFIYFVFAGRLVHRCRAGNAEFYNIEIATLWRIFHSCLIPILTYGAETWIPTKAELKYAQNILDSTIKRILITPTSTPSEIIIAETGIWDIETQMEKKANILPQNKNDVR